MNPERPDVSQTTIRSTPRVFLNSARDGSAAAPQSPGREPRDFHERLPGYAPSPLVDARGLASLLGIDRVWVKDESSRLGLPAFKILGASWAAYRALEQHAGGSLGSWQTFDDLVALVKPLRPLTLAAATDGNHGRAVARMARLLGFESRIYVPSDMVQARRDAIASEGAAVVIVHGTYDEAVARSAEEADERTLVISDTAWEGYQDIPRWTIDGYSTILQEVEDELARLGEPGPNLVSVQIGVGALATAVITHFRQPERVPNPAILGVEPTRAACMLASVEAGELVQLPGPHDSIMAGLNCGLASPIAFPVVSAQADALVAIENDRAREAMRAFAAEGLVAGETGSAGLAGLLDICTNPAYADARAHLGIGTDTRALVFITEGATDPGAWEEVVGRELPERG
jgi:diaminopropionate ammonia-lyase